MCIIANIEVFLLCKTPWAFGKTPPSQNCGRTLSFYEVVGLDTIEFFFGKGKKKSEKTADKAVEKYILLVVYFELKMGRGKREPKNI